MIVANSRTSKSLFSAMTGLTQHFLRIVLGFLTRTVFIKTLGVRYLGVNGLFTNIISVLSIADLGIGVAMTFYLYKPLAEQNIEKLSSLIQFYKSAYRIIGLAIFFLGISIMPFLHRLVKMDNVGDINLHVIYLLFLLNTVSTYLFFAYRSSIIHADQKGYVLNGINSIFLIVSNLVEVIILLVFKNFILALSVRLSVTVINNIFISIIAGRLYPFIRQKDIEKLPKQEIKGIFKKIYSIFVLRLGGRMWDSTDNIIISSMIGTIYVGINSNYVLLMTSIIGIVNTVRSSFVASVGNINAIESTEIKYKTYRNLELLNSWVTCFCSVCFFELLNPFITLWLGMDYLFSQPIVAVIVANFFLLSYIMIILMFQETMGLFEYGRLRNLIGGVANIVLSLILAEPLGIFGVFLATLICALVFNNLAFPKIIYKYGFAKPFKAYVVRYLGSILVTIGSIGAISMAFGYVEKLNWMTFLFKFVLCLIVPNVIFFVVYKNTDEFRWIRDKVSFIIRNQFLEKKGNYSGTPT